MSSEAVPEDQKSYRACVLSSVHPALDNRVFYREAQSLCRAGYDVTLVAVHEQDELKEGVMIRALPKVPRWKRPLIWWTLFRVARQSGADVYHFHDPELLVVTPLLRLISRKPTIYDIHEVYADFIKVKDYMPVWLRYPIAWLFRWLEPVLAGLQSGLIFADDEIGRQFRGFRGPKTTLFNYPSSAFVKQAAQATESIERTKPLVLYLGSMERNRGSELMLKAFALVRRRVPNAQLMMVGQFAPPELEEDVLSQADKLHLADAFSYAGQVPFEEIGHYLRQAAIGWVTWQPVPKNEKNIPTKLFEYMAYGLPVVCSDLPSTRPFVNSGHNGFLVMADDPRSHADAIVRLLENRELAIQLGANGQEMVANEFNWDAMEARLLAFYKQVLGWNSPRASQDAS